jgi:hypothetical protein
LYAFPCVDSSERKFSKRLPQLCVCIVYPCFNPISPLAFFKFLPSRFEVLGAMSLLVGIWDAFMMLDYLPYVKMPKAFLGQSWQLQRNNRMSSALSLRLRHCSARTLNSPHAKDLAPKSFLELKSNKAVQAHEKLKHIHHRPWAT